MTDQALSQSVRRRLAEARKPPKEWSPPTLADLAGNVEVLAFDPSLLHTGVVSLCLVRGEIALDAIMVHFNGTINLSSELAGFKRSWDLAHKLREHLGKHVPVMMSPHYVAIETPAVSGMRTESSLLAGCQVWSVFSYLGDRRRLIQANHVSAVLCGNPGHDKKEIAAAVARYIPDSTGRHWSEHQRDAAATGLTLLHDLQQEMRRRDGKHPAVPFQGHPSEQERQDG